MANKYLLKFSDGNHMSILDVPIVRTRLGTPVSDRPFPCNLGFRIYIGGKPYGKVLTV